MPVKRPTLVPETPVSEAEIMSVIERGGSSPRQAALLPADPPQSGLTGKSPELSAATGKRRGPKTGTSRAASTAEVTHRHTLYLPEELYEELLAYQRQQRKPWPSLNTLILQAIYRMIEEP